MTSKIINMAERIKDEQDRLLESMFASDPIADAGFSANIVGRIRRRIWLRRLILPVAVLIGAVVAFKPMASLAELVFKLLQLMPDELVNSATAHLPTLQVVATGGLLLVAAVISLSMLED